MIKRSLINLSRSLGVLTVGAALSIPAFPQAQAQPQGGQAQPQPQGGQPAAQPSQGAAGQPQWKDRAEYDLYEAITKETTPAKKLELLNSWKEKYPATEFKQPRLVLFLDTYRQLNRTPDVIAAAKEILAIDPKDATALYWIATLAPFTNDTSPAALELAEKAGNGLLSNLDATFAADKKPANMSADQWAKARKDIEVLGHKTLGWSSMMRKNNEGAEKEFKATLNLNPADAQVSYWLAQTIAGQRQVERQPEALWHYARAAAYDGPGALAPAGRKEIEAYLAKAYAGFHGDDAKGLEELKNSAKTSALPPAGFTIRNVRQLQEEKLKAEQAALEADPQKGLWKRLRETLASDAGESYWNEHMKDSKLPEKSLRGKVVETSPAGRSIKEIKVALMDDTTADAVLRFDTPVVGKADPGTVVEFTGVPRSYTKDPFLVTFDVEKGDVTGIQSAAPAARRPAPARRKR